MGRANAENRKTVPHVLTDDEYAKLTGVLASQRQLGSYPLTVARLLELANMAWPGEGVLTNAAAAKRMLTTATKNAKKEALLSALVFLPEDWDHLASYERTLRYFIERRLGEVKSQACTVAKMLEKGSNSKVLAAVKEQIKQRLEARQLPAGIGALKMGATQWLFIFDHIIGRPADLGRRVADRQPAQEEGGFAPRQPVATELEHSERSSGAVRTHADEVPAASAPPEYGRFDRNAETARPPDRCGLANRMEAAFDRLDRASGGHNQVLLFHLRRELSASREDFDACMNQLRRDGVFTLSPEEGRFGHLPTDHAEAGIEGPSGRLVYAARR